MIRIFTSILLISLFISGCFSEELNETIKENRFQLGEVKINYYSDKSVTSLEVPPDLTAPKYENSFRISEYVSNVDPNYVDLGGKELDTDIKDKVLPEYTDILVKKAGTRRWLEVNKNTDLVWNLSRQFLKEQGFVIKKSNKKIGFMETDYLENKPEIPAKSLGLIRSFLSTTIDNVSYTLPSVDKYSIRIEPLDSGERSQVHLSISSMAEVNSKIGGADSTFWQSKERDVSLETEMLYMLMVFLGSDAAKARENIIDAKDEGKVFVELADGINGYGKLVFKLNFIDTWDNMAWAITNLNIQLDDKDLKEKSFYINVANEDEKGVFSTLFGTDAISKAYQLQLKSIEDNLTEVYFNDISGVNDQITKQFSYQFLGSIQKQF